MNDPIRCCTSKIEKPIERPHIISWETVGQTTNLWAMCDWHHAWIITRFWEALVNQP